MSEHLEGCQRFDTGWLCVSECEAPGICPECERVYDSFACKIRHQHIDLRWTRGIH